MTDESNKRVRAYANVEFATIAYLFLLAAVLYLCNMLLNKLSEFLQWFQWYWQVSIILIGMALVYAYCISLVARKRVPTLIADFKQKVRHDSIFLLLYSVIIGVVGFFLCLWYDALAEFPKFYFCALVVGVAHKLKGVFREMIVSHAHTNKIAPGNSNP
jgi:hypothetical protein